jgi:hypothetical protein
LPVTEPGDERLKFAVAVCPAETLTEFFSAVPKPVAETWMSYPPAVRFVME